MTLTNMKNMPVKILPSLLAADFAVLGQECKRAEEAGADELHLDIMDGHFVPNLSFGPDVVAMAKKMVEIPLNVHLMLTHPDRYLERFAEAGATTIQIHVESDCDVAGSLRKIRELGLRSGIVLSPDTRPEEAAPYLELSDEALCMTVYPGYGGQAFMERVLPKVKRLREMATEACCKNFDLMVDGGIGMQNIVLCAEAGANAFVAGSSLYRAADMAAEVLALRRLAEEA